MEKKNSLIDIFEKHRYDLHSASRKSQSWFDQQVLLISKKGMTAQKLINSGRDHLRTTVLPGNMYMFFYDAKHKETLPYWDRFPLVLPFNKTATGFHALNLHYLPYQLRVRLLDRLMMFKNNDKMDETTRLKYSWQMIAGASRFKMITPCVKQYLSENVQSPFLKIDAINWPTAMLLPVEKFVGSSKQAIWTESKRSI